MRVLSVTGLALALSLHGLTASAQTLSSSDFGLFVGGVRIEHHSVETLSDALAPVSVELAKYLGLGLLDLRNDETRKRLDDLLRRVEDGTATAENTPPIFHGLEGFSTVLAFRSLYNITGGIRPPSVRGKIRDYFFHEDTRSGHLSVHMEIDHYDASGRLHARVFQQWDVRIKPGGYQVKDRNNAAIQPGDFFPGTIDLPKESTDQGDLRSIWVRNLDHKLFARGPSAIEVQNVYQRIQTAASEGKVERLANGNNYYALDVDSCIDILLAGHPPATQLPPQIGYCLGRCTSPGIMNSN